MRWVAGAALLALGLAGCGGASGSAGGPSTTTSSRWVPVMTGSPQMCPNSNAWRCYPQPDGTIWKAGYRGAPGVLLIPEGVTPTTLPY